MRRRFYPQLAAVALILPAGGCVQSVRHSNTMLFGTNTSFGIKVGTAPNQVPSITVGHDRQEAVIMPLVANTRDNGQYQMPCTPEPQLSNADGPEPFVHPCALVAINGKARDSYSVLASFGAKFGGEGATGGTKVNGGLAQYFATGVAAQLLALNGGASVVAVGEAAAVAAAKGPDTQTIEALYGGTAAAAEGKSRADQYVTFRDQLLARIQGTDPVDSIKERMTAFERRIGAPGRFADRSGSIADCKAVVLKNNAYVIDFEGNEKLFEQALIDWNKP